jgi:DNA-binding PadR family transcriptional regulator
MKRITETELLVLRELAGHPDGLYGLEIVDKSDGRVKRGSVYVLLSRLKKAKYVDDSKLEPPPEGYGGLPRPIYHLTALGKRAVEIEDLREQDLVGVPA